MRKIAAIAAVFLVPAGTCVAQAGTLAFGINAGAEPGFISMNLVLTAQPGAQPAAVQWTMNYSDSDVAGLIVTEGPAASAADKTVTCAKNKCVLWGLNTQTIQSGVVAIVTFQLAGGAAGPIAFGLSGALAASPAADAIVENNSGGSLSVVLQPSAFAPAVAGGLAVAASAAQIVSSGGWDTTTTLINTGSQNVSARLQTFSPTGNPLSLPLIVQTSDPLEAVVTASLDQTISPGASLAVETSGPGVGQSQVGSSQLVAAGSVGGFLRFRYDPSGQEAAASLDARNAGAYLLAFDNTNGAGTGAAVANLTGAPVNVPVVIRDNLGTVVESSTIWLAANGQASLPLSESFASTANLAGTVEFDNPAAARISVLATRSTPSKGFTTLPVFANADSGNAGNASIAHLAVGAGWTTSILLVSTGSASAQVHLHFLDDNGLDLPLACTSAGSAYVGASLDQSIPPKGTAAIDCSTPDGSPLTGSGQISVTGSATGFVRFIYSPTGQESIVPFETRDAPSYFLAFDNTNGMGTGIAVANLTSEPASIPVSIRDVNGTLLGSETVSIPPNGHTAFGLSDSFPETANQAGVLEFVPSGARVSVIGMRLPPSGNFSSIPVITP